MISEPLRRSALAAIRELPVSERARLFALANVAQTGGGTDESAAALGIVTGALTAATLRALPGPVTHTTAEAASALGQYRPNPRLAAIVEEALDPLKDPPCAGKGSSDHGEAGVQGALQALARGGDLQQIVGAVLGEMFKERLCDRIRELIEAFKRAADISDPALRERLVRDQARLERVPVPLDKRSREYRRLERQAVRAYVLHGSISDVETDSGGPIARQAQPDVAALTRPGGPSGAVAEKVQARADAELRDMVR